MNNGAAEEGQIAEERLLSIISKHTSPTFPLTLSTSLQRDLGLTGDDAYQLIQKIAHEFKVDLSEIDSRYFDDEFVSSIGFSLFLFAPLIWVGMFLSGKGKKTELFIGDLLQAIQAGGWRHPDRPATYPWQRLRKHVVKS